MTSFIWFDTINLGWFIVHINGSQVSFTFAQIDISYARFFFYESAEKVLSYARLNCAVFNYFYMSLGQVRHTIVVSRYQNHRKDNEIQGYKD